ncbi:uncharacterized protein LOC114260788 [Camellia sinensis]|uniref:uncharacterized protein LOC114260788 n=1 Tax=Camellia sinensis TaxID=4442 RepID=UPI001036B245|nr:uncharacterized protein LOC114260788 [Camellia sinensis]
MSEGCTSALIFLLCKYNGYTFAIKIDQNVTDDQLVEKLCLKWDNLQSDNICLSYSLPGHPNCTLDNNEELDLLLALVVHFDSKCIDVVVRVKDSTIDCGYLNNRLDYGERESMLDLEVCDIALSHDNSKSVNLSNRASTSSKRNSRLEVEEKVDTLSSFCRHKGKFSIECGFEFIFVKNDKVRVTAQCLFKETKSYMWNVHGRVENANEFFYIRKLNNVHTCGAEVRTMTHSRMSSDLVADLIVEGVRDNPLTRPVHVVRDFKLGYGLRLRWYVDVAKSCNPGSYIEFEYDDDTKRFNRLFVSFHGSISGFDYYRPLLFLDGTFLKGRFRGNLLAATGKDGNQGFFPVCFAVVGSENQDNWRWFLEHLSRIVSPERTITFVSDRNLGLVEVLQKVFLMAFHAYCLYHLKMNLRHHLRGGSRVEKFLDDISYDRWSNAYFRGQRFGEMWSNVAESFNLWIREECHLSITKLIDSVRIKLMRKIAKRRELVNKWNGLISPKMESKLHDGFNTSRPWIVSSFGNDVYEVHSHPSVSVDISRRICSCGEYRESYSFPIYPVPSIWKPDCNVDGDNEVVLLPLSKKQPKRPNKKRIRSNGEKVRQITCSRCGKVGNHNKKSCKEAL